MRLSRTLSVSERRKNLRLGSLRTRKKHKRLDAICEKAYNRNHRGVKAESNECDVGGGSVGNESELRRSTRVRRPPVVLDASPPPAKKRRIVDKRGEILSVGREVRNNGVKSDSTCSTSRDVEETHGRWRSRLRSRAKNLTLGVRGKTSLPRGKRRLFEGSKEFSEEVKVQGKTFDDKEQELEGGLPTVVKSKRPVRIKASNISRNAYQEIDPCCDKDHGKEKNEVEGDKEKDEVEEDSEKNEVDVLDCGDEKDPVRLKSGDACESEHGGEDGTAQLVEKEDSEVPRVIQLEHCNDNDNVETVGQDTQMGLPESVKDGQNQRDPVQVGGVLTDQVEDEACHKKLLQDKNATEVDKNDCASGDTLGKLRVREGRVCGLCGTGTDGKPPKKLMHDGAGSDHEVYTGSSASEEPNYDKWDGFGDEPGWLGRLLGPINDRYGIAGIWVHQHCAVWSPEVYFAGLGCLKNVRAALCRGRVLKCTCCGRPGATIGCRVDRCPKTYHLPCARTNGCIFDHRKFLIACTDHRHLFQPHGTQQFYRMKKIKAKKMKLEMRKLSNEAWRKDLEAEEKWLENCGEDEEFLKRESKRLHRDLLRIAPVYIGGSNSENEIPSPGWESVAGLQDVIQCMKEVVILPLLYPEFFSNMGLTPPRGVLLHGYPGTGKTLVVRALIGSCARGDKRIAYFARKGADCLGKYVGDAERQLRLLFQVAEKSQPSIIFFDEIDGLAPCRTRQQDQTHNSVVSTLLALLDGLKSRGSVVVIGATNRPDAVDPALRRPGRFDREIYFPLPSVEGRAAILSLHTQRWPKPVTGSLLQWIARRTVGFAGADLQALCTQAAIIALRRNCSLQELFSAAERKAPHGKCRPLPTFAVEERDWLEALSCAPPPCSQRGAGMAANGVESSPLHSYLSPCLLQPLSRLLVSLYLDERLLLPPPLYKAATLIKSVIVSALDKKKVLTDHWWSHVHELLEEADVLRNIGINLSLGGIFIEQANDSKFDAWAEDTTDESLKFNYPNVRQIGTRTSLSQNISYTSGKKLGFRMLISGSPRSGQRYLASCLLHCFVGNVEIQKIDLATISQEGHGDVIQGVTRILMRCASVGSCLVFMPRIDLWALETRIKVDKVDRTESDSFLTNPESSEDMSFVKQDNQFCEKVGELSEGMVSQDESPKTSDIWNLFVEQVESICVSTSLMILATSEVPFPVLPFTIRQFFKSETLDCSLSTPSEETIPQFCVHLDGNFNHDSVINSSAVELSNDLIQQFVRLIHHRAHVRLSSCMKDKICDTLEGGANQGCHGNDSGSANKHMRTQFPESAVVKVSCPLNTRPLKVKTSLLLAISTFGYQILRYPHFAELCWATSKLKEGPCADINGAWKGWPFNSCIIRPNNSLEKVTVSCSSSNIKSKEKSGLVRGLVAVGLSAYRGIYVSLREVSSEVRKVLELLAGEINAKIHSGKDRYQFIRLLSQMAYLEDVVNSWVYTLQSVDVDAQTSCPAPKLTSLGCLDNYKRCDDNPPQIDGCELDFSIQSSQKMLEGCLQRFELNKGAGDFDPISVGRVTTEGPHQQLVSHQPASDLHFQSSAAPDVVPLPGKLLNEHNGTNLEPCRFENPGNHSCVKGDLASLRHANGFACSQSVVIIGDDPCSGELGSVRPSSFEEANNQHNGLRMETGTPYEDGKLGCGMEQCVDINLSADNTASLSNDSGVVCFYRCCSECLFNLFDVMQKILTREWGLQGSRCTVEDVHDVVALLSVNLHSAVRKLFVAESSTISVEEKLRKDTIRKLFEHQENEACQCIGSEDRLTMPMECGGHRGSEESITGRTISDLNIEHGFDLKFICRDGVLSPVEPGKNISFHCKFETLCLRSLIEWILMTKQPSD